MIQFSNHHFIKTLQLFFISQKQPIIHIVNKFYYTNQMQLGLFARTCNPSKWEADIWGWLEVRRSDMLHFNERQRPHWACRQYGHTGGTRGWLGVKRWQLCLGDTSRSATCHRRAAVGHWISVYVKCCRMVDGWNDNACLGVRKPVA